jgi:putative oxidoreductase
MANVHAVDLALLIFRCAIGAVFIAHGVNHIFGGGKIEGTGRWFESLGMKPGIVHAWVASITEIGAGALLVLGLLTAFGGAGVVGVMLVAWITNHLKNGFFIFRPGEGWEYVMVLTVSGLLLAAVGPGEWSIDNAAGLTHRRGGRGRRDRPPPAHLLATRGEAVGVVGPVPVLHRPGPGPT